MIAGTTTLAENMLKVTYTLSTGPLLWVLSLPPVVFTRENSFNTLSGLSPHCQ